jgi:hypothetical protein
MTEVVMEAVVVTVEVAVVSEEAEDKIGIKDLLLK